MWQFSHAVLVIKCVPKTDDVLEAHHDLQTMGLDLTPGARKLGKKELSKFKKVLKTHPIVDQLGQVPFKNQLKDKHMEVIVMEYTEGVEAYDLEMESETAQQIGPKFFRDLGKLIVFDTITGNHDRIKVNVLGGPVSVSTNMMNLLISNTGLPIPIDNTMNGSEKRFTKQRLQALKQGVSKDTWVMGFGLESPALGQLVMNDENYEALQAGIEEGLERT